MLSSCLGRRRTLSFRRRCHRVVLAARSEYFSALLRRSKPLPPDEFADIDDSPVLPAFEMHDVSAGGAAHRSRNPMTSSSQTWHGPSAQPDILNLL